MITPLQRSIRQDGRQFDQPRPLSFQPDFAGFATSSVLTCCGQTRVLVTVSIEDSVPKFLAGSGQGWLTAEYRMLPGATHERHSREFMKLSGRTQEIQRLIGRSLRSCLDMKLLGEKTITIDADVSSRRSTRSPHRRRGSGSRRRRGSDGAFIDDACPYARPVEEKLLAWFAENGRDLPWRRTRDPYAILVSEVMAQQTQMERVLLRWERWMERWPTVESLAAAPVAEVIREWQGLGYNRRALAIHAAAKQVAAHGGPRI